MPFKKNNIKHFFNLGVSEGQAAYIQKKIVIANYLSTIFMIIPIFFLVLCYLFFPSVAFVFLVSVFVPPLVIFLNYLGINLLARFLLGGLPTVLGFIFCAYLVQGNHILPYGSITSLFTMVAIAFVLFDIREIIYPILILCLNITCFLFFPQLDRWFALPMNVDFLYSNTYNYIGLINSFSILFFSFLILQKINLNSEKEKQTLVEKTKENNQNLIKQKSDLNQTLEQLRQAQVENYNQTWVVKGTNLINEVIHHHNNSENLYYEITQKVNRYLGALQTGIYLVKKEHNKMYLELEAESALKKGNLTNTQFLKGEGLIGQVWESKESIVVENLPKQHIHHSLGIATIKVNAVLLVPIVLKDTFLGVFEFYLGQKPEKHQINFVETISENIALTIQNLLEEGRRDAMTRKYKKQKEEAEIKYQEMHKEIQLLSGIEKKLSVVENENILQKKLLDNSFAIIHIDDDYDVLTFNTKAQQILEIMDKDKEYSLATFISPSILTKQIEKMKFGYIWQDAIEIRTARKNKIILNITAGVLNDKKDSFHIFLH